MAAPCESNIVYSEVEEERVIRVIEMCHRLGYRSVILNNIWKDDSPTIPDEKRKQKGKQKKAQPPEVLPASKLKQIKTRLSHLGKDFHIYSRFTLVLEDVSQSRMLQKDPLIQGYDILAVKPVSEKMCELACKNLDIDIITFDFTEKLPFYLARHKIRMAVERGIHFEISYTPMLLSRDARRHTISSGQLLVEYSKGKNIILSGCCMEEMDVRGSYDVANLGTLFGLNLEQCRNSVTRNCHQMILHAEGRKSALGVVRIKQRSDVKEQWILEEGQVYDESEDEKDETDSDDNFSGDDVSPKKKRKLNKHDQTNNGLLAVLT